MRKRVIISVVITLIILFCSNKFWLDIKPISIDFSLQGNGKCNIAVQLNKKNDNKFNKVKSESKNINLEKTKFAKFDIKRSKYPKKFRIVIDNCENSNLIKIKNIQFRNGKYKFYEMDKYTVVGAKSEVKNNELIIYPENEAIYITYNDKIKVKASMKFNFEVFVIILVLSFLLIYKASDYVADFSTIKHKSRIDITFLLIFFSFLFVPMSHINQDIISKQENRKLATWQPFIKKNGEINFNFGKDYEKWFNDRFCFRDEFVKSNAFVKSSFNNIYSNNKATLDNKYKLLYTPEFYGLRKIKNKNFNQELKNYAWNVNKLQAYCEKRNIKLYILVVPRKSDFFEHTVLDIKKENCDKGEEVVDYLRKHTQTMIIYPKEEMLGANKITPIYFKTDHHWTKKGAYIGYQKLISEIQKDFPQVPLLQENDLEKYYDNRVSEHWNRNFNNGQTAMLLGFSNRQAQKYLDIPYLYYKNKKDKDLKRKIPAFECKIKTYDYDDFFYYPQGANLKVMVIGNSFARNLVSFLPYSFARTLRLYDNHRRFNLKIYEPIFNEYKPDILILNYDTAALFLLLEPFKQEKEQ